MGFDDEAKVGLSVDPRAGGGGPVRARDRAFHVVVVGDFSGSAGGGEEAEGGGAIEILPADSPDEALARLRPRLSLDLEGPGPAVVEFSGLEDFHPDRLVARLPHLRSLHRAIDPAVQGRAERRSAPAEGEPGDVEGGAGGVDDANAPDPPGEPREGASAAGLLDEIVEAGDETVPVSDPDDPLRLRAWIEEVVEPHLVAEETDDQRARRERLEGRLADEVRRVLHAPGFRRLESLWRSLLLLAATAGPSSKVRLHLLDASRDRLEAELLGGELASSAMVRALGEPLPEPGGSGPPALLVVATEIGGATRDLALANRLAIVAHALEVPCLAAAGPGLLGWPSYRPSEGADPEVAETPSTWEALRATPAARSLGLAAPRFLVREPYGASTDPCRLVPLEEVLEGRTGPDAGESGARVGEAGAAGRPPYLWGNPAFAVAASILASFVADEWAFEPDARPDLHGRPIHVTADGEVGAHPTEALWTSDVLRTLFDAGVMPLVAYRGEARLRLPRIGSVAKPPTPLSAWWNRARG